MMIHTFRLKPGDDLKASIQNYAKKHGIQAAGILTGVGSLTHAVIRVADGQTLMRCSEEMEIVSLGGTIAQNGCHIHLSVSRTDGSCVGGHLCDGCIINTTAEIMLIQLTDTCFTRQLDPETGCKELTIQKL